MNWKRAFRNFLAQIHLLIVMIAAHEVHDSDEAWNNSTSTMARHVAESNSTGVQRELVGSTFNMRIFWKPGYCWQEICREWYWCMQCKLNRCPANSSIKVERCNRSDSRQQFFFDSGRIRSRKNPRVCLNRDGRSIILKPCSTSRHQKWAQLSKSDEFQLRIPGRSDKCASQHHWPRTGERVYMTSCKRSRTSQTDKWIAY